MEPNEQRRHPRIQLPLLVELKHPSLSTQRCLARDISAGGVYVHTDNPQIKPGAKVKVTLLNTLSVEAQPTPTVDMDVVRVDAQGLALQFSNAAGRHLWHSVERLRSELTVGRDYFQVHLNVALCTPAGAILLVQQHGKWAFPATFAVVGQDWREAVTGFIAAEFGLPVSHFGGVLEMVSVGNQEVPEGAVLDVFVQAHTPGGEVQLREGSRYRGARFTDRRRDVEESTFATEQARALAQDLLLRMLKNEGTP